MRTYTRALLYISFPAYDRNLTFPVLESKNKKGELGGE